MDPAYRPLQESLSRHDVSTELSRPPGGWFSLNIFYSFASEFPKFVTLRHSKHGWFVDLAPVYQITDESKVVDVCVALSRGTESVESVIRRFGLEKRENWWREEVAAQNELWRSVGWRELSDQENDAAWDLVQERLDFPSDHLSLPQRTMTWDLSFLYDYDLYEYDEAVSRLNYAALVAFRRCLPAGEALTAIDFNHPGYSLSLDAGLQSGDLALWPVTVFGDGDYHLFTSSDLRCGVAGHPYGKLMVFGDCLIEAMASQLASTPFAAQLKNGTTSE